jgi:hypothetical protein
MTPHQRKYHDCVKQVLRWRVGHDDISKSSDNEVMEATAVVNAGPEEPDFESDRAYIEKSRYHHNIPKYKPEHPTVTKSDSEWKKL